MQFTGSHRTGLAYRVAQNQCDYLTIATDGKWLGLGLPNSGRETEVATGLLGSECGPVRDTLPSTSTWEGTEPKRPPPWVAACLWKCPRSAGVIHSGRFDFHHSSSPYIVGARLAQMGVNHLLQLGHKGLQDLVASVQVIA